MIKFIILLYLSYSYSLENIVLNRGNKEGVYYCPDQIIIDNQEYESKIIKITSDIIDKTCIKSQRGCYIKHCINDKCIRFCLYRPPKALKARSHCEHIANIKSVFLCCIATCHRHLWSPDDKYYSDNDCPAFTNGIDLWYVSNSFTADSLYKYQ